MKIAAKIISYVFHPLFMPLVGVFIILNTESYVNYTVPPELKHFVFILLGMCTIIIPLLISLLLLNRKIISSLEMETQKERIIPYVFTIGFYVFTLHMLTKVPLPSIVFKYMMGVTLSVIIAFVINLKWKISAHMIGIGGLIGALFSMSILLEIYITPYFIIGLFVAGLIGSARLALKVHSPSQIYSGFFVGILCQLVFLLF